MIDFTQPVPLQEAVDSLGRKSPLGLALSSAEIERLPQELKDASFFSATVESERVLAIMQEKLMQRLRLERDKLANGEPGTFMDRSGFIAEMQAVLDAEGYKPEPGKQGGLQDVSSARRLGLIWDMQLAMAHGYANWLSGMDPDILDAVPAQELVRIEDREEPRIWPEIWAKAGGTMTGGRMIALKTDEIWTKISRFNKPWPPFDWGSGMGLKNVRRREAEKLGLLGPDDLMKPLKMDFTKDLKASTRSFPAASIERLRSTHGDTVAFDPARQEIAYKGGSAGALRARSRAAAEAMQEAGEDRAEVVASLTAVATGRSLLALVPRSAEIPAGVDTIAGTSGDNVWVFRKDRLNFAELMRSTPEERARWQGLAAAGEPFALVIVRGPAGERIELRVPKAAAAVWAAARLMDFTLALGSGWTATVDGKAVTP